MMTSTESVVCAWDGCFENIENACEVCKKSFCGKHSQKDQFQTTSGKSRYGSFCIDHLELAINDQVTTSSGFSQVGVQLIGLAIIIIVIFLLWDIFIDAIR